MSESAQCINSQFNAKYLLDYSKQKDIETFLANDIVIVTKTVISPYMVNKLLGYLLKDYKNVVLFGTENYYYIARNVEPDYKEKIDGREIIISDYKNSYGDDRQIVTTCFPNDILVKFYIDGNLVYFNKDHCITTTEEIDKEVLNDY